MRGDAGRRALLWERPTDPLGWWPSIAFATVCTAVVVLIRALLFPLLGFQAPFITFTLSVAVAAWLVGWRAGVLSGLLAIVAGQYFFVYPDFAFGPLTRETLSLTLLFAAVSGVLIALAHTARSSREQAFRLLRQLEVERGQYHEILENLPTLTITLVGDDLVFEHANAAYLRLPGRENILGKPMNLAIPEADENGYSQMIREVMHTGTARFAHSAPLEVASEPGERSRRDTSISAFSPCTGARTKSTPCSAMRWT